MVIDETALRKPDVSITLGARLLGSLRSSFSANRIMAVAAYNCGAGAVRRWLSLRSTDDLRLLHRAHPLRRDARLHVAASLASQAAYAFLYAPHALDELLTLPLHAAGQDATIGR